MGNAGTIARACGVVGAGGAGFPTHVKLSAKAEVFAVNAAECEPLLYKDQTILEEALPTFTEGLMMCAEAVGATRVLVGIKEKHREVIERLRDGLPPGVDVCPLRDTYPSGDEHILVYDTTGRTVPKGGIPLDVGVVVNNVETILNVGAQKPVTEKWLTVSGAIPEALSGKVPLGITLLDVLRAAGAPTEGMGFIVNGPMMGFVTADLLQPVTKTTSGILVLPAGHSLLQRKGRSAQAVHKIAYTCDQCMRCSDFCPRDLLGHIVKPHKAMISVGFSPDEATAWQKTALYCCECALCTLYACPEDLDPFRVMVESKRALAAKGVRPLKEAAEPIPMYDYRRTPTSMLVRRLDLDRFMAPHRFADFNLHPKKLTLPLKQHAGVPARAVVKAGDRVAAGGLLADIPEGALGAKIFSPLAARVLSVDAQAIRVEVA